VWTLGKSRDSRALPTILRLTHDPDERVCYDAVLALGELGDTQAVPVLEEIARRPSDPAALDIAARSALNKLKSLL
ncbi:MAG: HEAT repeat domain-containing protein, partial [Armatimonadota bacterium]|nr:HEAT repeat domain-containing protein [Armatimonadota bacterium]